MNAIHYSFHSSSFGLLGPLRIGVTIHPFSSSSLVFSRLPIFHRPLSRCSLLAETLRPAPSAAAAAAAAAAASNGSPEPAPSTVSRQRSAADQQTGPPRQFSAGQPNASVVVVARSVVALRASRRPDTDAAPLRAPDGPHTSTSHIQPTQHIQPPTPTPTPTRPSCPADNLVTDAATAT
jgi:hypothetical protein